MLFSGGVTTREAPRRWMYPAIGIATSPLLPIGLLVLDLATGLELPPLTYAYLAIAGALVFATLGFVVGRSADRLRHLSNRDALTQLWNRAALDLRLAEELQRVRRTQQPLALLVLDLDHFKEINDRLGHAAGDAVLRHVANCLRGASRATDVAARYGGDEFIVLAPATAAVQALRLAERIRDAVARPASMHGIEITVSVSIGIAGVQPDQSTTPAELLAAADSELYAAKALGRNRVQQAQVRPGRSLRSRRRRERDHLA